MTWDRNTSMLENVAAISGDFHTHNSYEEFYDTFGPKINGFPGIYAICIAMAKAMTEWEASHISRGAMAPFEDNDLDWIVVVEEFVGCLISNSLVAGYPVNPSAALTAAIEKARAP